MALAMDLSQVPLFSLGRPHPSEETGLSPTVSMAEATVLRDRLNEARGRMDGLCRQDERDTLSWCYRLVNPFELLNTKSPPLASRAVFKFMELDHQFSLCPSDETLAPWKTTHLCEAPGGFIQAAWHAYSKRVGRVVPVEPHAVSLPQDDAKWFEHLPSTTRVHRADLLSDPFVDELCHSHLVTADGGIPLAGDQFNRQEEVLLPLLRAEVDWTLKLLAPGGHAVIKFFDMFTLDTLTTAWRLARNFRTAYVMKPRASRVCNSERYLVCLGFWGVQQASPQETGEEYTEQVPSWFLQRAAWMNCELTRRQIQALDEAWDIFQRYRHCSYQTRQQMLKHQSKRRAVVYQNELQDGVPPDLLRSTHEWCSGASLVDPPEAKGQDSQVDPAARPEVDTTPVLSARTSSLCSAASSSGNTEPLHGSDDQALVLSPKRRKVAV